MTGNQRYFGNRRLSRATLLLRSLLCVAITASISALEARAGEPKTVDNEREIQDLIYLAPRSPIFVRLRIRIEGSGLRTQRETYAKELFDKLDTSGDGLLQDSEIKTIPPAGHLVPVGSNNSTASVARFGAADADDSGTVTREEFTTYILRASGAPFQINAAVQQPSGGQNVQLFDRLDRNHDNRLTTDELTQAARNLRLMDYDFDERIIPDEIRIPTLFGNTPQAENGPAAQASASMALIEPINRNYVDDSLIRKVIQLYDKLSRGPANRRFIKDRQLSAKELGQRAEVISEYDRNRDGVLNQQELRKYLANPQPAFEIVIDFGTDSTPASIKLIARDELPTTAPLGIRTTEDGSVAVRLNNSSYELVASPKIGSVRAARQLLNAFSGADNDKNKYLDRNEFLRVGGGTGANGFNLVDTDRDGMVVEEEFTSFAKQQVELQKHVVSLGLANRSQTLFSVVDTSRDGQLDADELAELKSRILEMDRNNDGVFERTEISGSLQMVLARGNVGIGQSNVSALAATRQSQTAPQIPPRSSWFAMMDRNRDGKLKKREFLGPLDVFHKLDADRSGWLDATEAK